MPARVFHDTVVSEKGEELSSTPSSAPAPLWEGGVGQGGAEQEGSAEAEGWAGPGHRRRAGGGPERPGRAEDEEEGEEGGGEGRAHRHPRPAQTQHTLAV